MSADHRIRVEQLYRSAMERDPARRGAFLAEACHGDDSLRSEVEILLERSSNETATSTSSGGAIRTVNQFDILAKIGEGGMGRVYKARDRRLDRLVALKFLTPSL